MGNISGTQDAALEAIQRQLTHAVFEPGLLTGALQSMADFCGAEIAHLMIADGHNTLLQSEFSIDVDPMITVLEPQFQDINPRVLAIPLMSVGKSTQDRHFITRDEIAKDTAYQEMILPAGLGHFSAVPVVLNASMTAGIALHRPYELEEFSSETIERHEAVAAACAPVFELARLSARSGLRRAVRMDDGGSYRICIDSNGREIDRSARVERLFERGTLALSPARRIRFRDQAADTQFAAMLDASTGPAGDAFIVRDAHGRPDFIATLLPFPDIVLAGELAGARLLVLKPLREPRGLQRRLLQAAFGLTGAEMATAKLLYSGLTLAEISSRRDVSINTTQTLMKRLLSKMDCRRQAEAIGILSKFAD